MNIFPYEKIPYGANIVLHGYGKVGREIVCQLIGNSYCNIVAVVDRKADYFLDCPIPIYDMYTEIPEKYEYVVIAVENPGVVKEIRSYWKNLGICENRVIAIERYNENLIERPYIIKDNGVECVSVGILCTSGLGDAIIDYVFACRIKRLLKSQCRVTLITQYSDLFDDFGLVDEVKKNVTGDVYDLFFRNMMIPIIEYWSPKKIKTYSNVLYEFCQHCINDLNGFNYDIDYLKYLYFGKLHGKKRFEMMDIHSLLPLSDNRKCLQMSNENYEAVARFGLTKCEYIVVNRDVDQVQSMRHPKLWPISYYNRLIELLKKEHNELKIVQVGGPRKDNAINNTDLDLTGRTTLKEIRSLLFYSKYLISCEGGLVHLNHLLGKKSVVLFGPTDETFFNYDEDIVCVKRDGWCSIACNYIRTDYVDGCIKGKYPAGCMADLTPEYVYECIKTGGL